MAELLEQFVEADEACAVHRFGKIEIRSTIQVRDNADLALAYTPGVGRVSKALAENPSITEGMKLAAASAIANLVGEDLSTQRIVPDPFDTRLTARGRDGCREGGTGRPSDSGCPRDFVAHATDRKRRPECTRTCAARRDSHQC